MPRVTNKSRNGFDRRNNLFSNLLLGLKCQKRSFIDAFTVQLYSFTEIVYEFLWTNVRFNKANSSNLRFPAIIIAEDLTMNC